MGSRSVGRRCRCDRWPYWVLRPPPAWKLPAAFVERATADESVTIPDTYASALSASTSAILERSRHDSSTSNLDNRCCGHEAEDVDRHRAAAGSIQIEFGPKQHDLRARGYRGRIWRKVALETLSASADGEQPVARIRIPQLRVTRMAHPDREHVEPWGATQEPPTKWP